MDNIGKILYTSSIYVGSDVSSVFISRTGIRHADPKNCPLEWPHFEMHMALYTPCTLPSNTCSNLSYSENHYGVKLQICARLSLVISTYT